VSVSFYSKEWGEPEIVTKRLRGISPVKPACVNRSQEILDDGQYETYFSPKKPSDGDK